MKLCVLVLSLLLASASSGLRNITRMSSEHSRVPYLNPELQDQVPDLSFSSEVTGPLTPEDQDQLQDLPPFFVFEDHSNLKWVTWEGSLPNGAVSIYNGYAQRVDYVCQHRCEAGFYCPSLDPYCHYPYGEKEYRVRDFEILVNKDNFEFLEWKGGSYGSIPQHSIRTCPGVGTYVGKNKYDLGKVVPKFKAFFLPWGGYEYWYKTYQVMTVNRDAQREDISDVKYDLDKVEIFTSPPETMLTSGATNYECREVVKSVTLTKSTQVEKTWGISSATTLGITGSITAEIPFIGSAGIEMSVETTLQFTKETTVTETTTHSMTIQLTVPPNHHCSVHMEGRKMKANIPYTARLSRTYHNGETRWTSITGTFDGVQMGDVQAVADRCVPVEDPQPCS